APAHARADLVAARAEPVVLELEVEAAVKVERGAILVEMRADSPVVAEHEIDLLGAGEERALDDRDRDALRPVFLLPHELRHERARLDRHAQDRLILADEARDRLADDARLRGEDA